MELGRAGAHRWCLEDLGDDPALSPKVRRGSGPAAVGEDLEDSMGLGLNKLLVQIWR